MQKKILVISNNCFSLENSNGRTLANMLYGWPKDCIAQFYIHNELPDFDICHNYFKVTDKEALFSLFIGPVNGKVKNPIYANSIAHKNKSLKKFKSPFSLIIRNIIWNLRFWRGKDFNNWLDSFNPDIVLLQAGDCTFMLKLARDIAIERNIPLIIYNSEGHYFIKNNYLTSGKLSKCLYPVFMKNYRKHLEETMAYASHIIYSCEQLKNDFDAVFNKPSSVIYTASKIKSEKYEHKDNKQLKISYLGNLTWGRHESLIEIANIIKELNPELSIDIYGQCSSSTIYEALVNSDAVNYRGFVPYDKVLDILYESDILLHVENFSESYLEDVKYGFSTKIADSLMSGRCFFLYAPKSLACSQYMLKYNPDCFASNKEELKIKLSKLIFNKDARINCALKSLNIAKQNHSIEAVQSQFKKIINSI